MKINEFLLPGELENLSNGNSINGSNVEKKRIFDFINMNCSEFLSMTAPSATSLTSKFRYRSGLFRGMLHTTDDAFVGSSKDRNSINQSAQKYQELCDLYLKLAGYKALRSNSVFCSTDYNRIKEFGNSYLIFPINGFKFTYALAAGPATEYLYPNSIDSIDDAPGDQIELKKNAKEFVRINEFKKTNLKYAMSHHHDIWFIGKYVALSIKKFSRDWEDYIK